MGVINLGVLVKKIMGKIAGAGYVKNTDYASNTSAGVIKTDTTYATEVTSGGKLKGKTIAAANYAEANAGAFVSKGTLDALITAGAIGGGGMTWTKLFEGAASSSSSHTVDDGVHLFAHTLLLVFTYTTGGDCAAAATIPEIIPSDVTTIKMVVTRNDGARTITFTDTGFSMPNNMNAANVIIYGLD